MSVILIEMCTPCRFRLENRCLYFGSLHSLLLFFSLLVSLDIIHPAVTYRHSTLPMERSVGATHDVNIGSSKVRTALG